MHPPSTLPFLILALLGAIGAPVAARAEGDVPAVAEEGLPVLHDYQGFWNLSEEARQQRHRIDFEALVLFYDPDWSVLWLENAGLQFFLYPGKSRWAIAPGDRIRVTGVVHPPRGYQVEGLRFEVVGTGTPPAALVFNAREDPGRFYERRCRVEGVVEKATETDPRHLELRLIAEGTAVNATVLIGDEEPIPQLTGAAISLLGVVTLRKDSAGRVQAIDMWVQDTGQIEVRGSLATDPRFDLAPQTSEQLLGFRAGRSVRFDGKVRHAVPGRTLTLWDDTGEVVVHSAQEAPVTVGTAIEAIGELEINGPVLRLRHAVWRPAGTPTPDEPLRKLRRAVQVLELSPAEAERQHPVDLLGVVTWSDPRASFFYIQDATRGVCVRTDAAWEREPPQPGNAVRVSGHTAMGAFAPVVRFERYALVSGISLPEPREVTLDQVRGGAEEGKLIELQGLLRAVAEEGPWTVLSLTSQNGEFSARVPNAPDLAPQIGAVVRIQGVCTAIANARRQLVGIELLAAAASSLSVSEPAPADPFAAPEMSLATLRQFSPLQTPYRRIRTTGLVNFHAPGRLLLLEEAGEALEVLARSSERMPIGARVEVVGFPGFEAGHPVLREALFRPLPEAGAPPRPLAVAAGLQAELHDRLVRVTGRLIGAVRVGEGYELNLRGAGTTFVTNLPFSADLAKLPEGADLQIEGVYRVTYDEYGTPRGFQVLGRGPGDVVVLRRPSWLTRGRLLALAATLGAGGAVVGFWSVLLRRRVRAQTVQIREQLEQQSALERELQKAAKLESLGLLAGGIAHDFNNLLTVILGNLTLARLDERVEAAAGDCLNDAERGAQRARDLTQQLLTFAKGGDPHLTAVSLPALVREAAEFVQRGSKAACDFDFAPGLWTAEVDRGQIGQVVHNLVLNAIQAMSEGGQIRLAIRNAEIAAGSALPLEPGRYLELVVADTGPGMPAEVQARIFDPYFTTKKTGSGLGLATVHSIVRRHEGHVAVVSAPGEGTAFRVWLPASAALAAAPAAVVHHALPVVLAGRRVLVLDDEPDIRRMVTAVLQRMGMEVVAVADGGEAVDSFRTARAAGRPFDLVITDLTIPGGIGGKDAMLALLAMDPSVRAIVSSGYSNDPVLADHRAFGFRGMVRKPYDVEELAACVAQVLAEDKPPAPAAG